VGCSNGELLRFALQADDPNKVILHGCEATYCDSHDAIGSHPPTLCSPSKFFRMISVLRSSCSFRAFRAPSSCPVRLAAVLRVYRPRAMMLIAILKIVRYISTRCHRLTPSPTQSSNPFEAWLLLLLIINTYAGHLQICLCLPAHWSQCQFLSSSVQASRCTFCGRGSSWKRFDHPLP
jgi:hypothetical protein